MTLGADRRSTMRLATRLCLVAALFSVFDTNAADVSRPTPNSDADPFPITVLAVPGTVMSGQPGAAGKQLTIAGETLPAGQRAVVITIKAEGGAVVDSREIKPDAKGHYSVVPPVPAKAGVYEVSVVAPDGRGKASTTFRAVDSTALGAQADTTVQEAIKVAEAGLAAAEAKVQAQTDSPPKEKAQKKIGDARQVLGELRSRSGGGAIKGIIGAIASDAALQERTRPRLNALTAAVDDTARQTERVRQLSSTLSAADIGCHQLALVTEVFKGISALLNVKKRVLETGIGLAKDVVSDATSNKSKAAGASPALAFLSGQVVKNLPELESAGKLAGNAASILTDLGAFVSDTLFGIYCEQFVGPLEAIMNARFFTSSRAADPLREWWSYNFKLSGRVTLYYPKSAKGSPAIRLSGRIEGYAHGFETWEDALSVMFPKLMAGAIQHKFNYPPIEGGGTASAIASQGASPLSAYVEGSAAGLAVPNSFLIGVTGVLEKDAITLTLGPAKSDISATHRVAALIVSPLVGGLGPQVTWYPLGFQKVRPFLVNAADGETMKLMLKTQGDTMLAQGVFNGKVNKPSGKAEYTLKIKACNPGC